MAHLFWYTLPALVAAVLAFALTPLVARLAVRIGAIDMPGERKLHTAPIPRLGGLAVVVSIALVLLGSAWLSGGRWRLAAHLAPGLGFGVLPVLAHFAAGRHQVGWGSQEISRPCARRKHCRRVWRVAGACRAPVRHGDPSRLVRGAALGALDRRRHQRVQHHRRPRRPLGRPGADCRDEHGSGVRAGRPA